MWKRVTCGIAGALSFLLSLLSLLNFYYNLEPVTRSIPIDTETRFAIALFAVLTVSFCVFSFWLLKRALKKH
jgi:hypothetical protein